MLIIPYRIRKSSIHGLGVFAAEDIPKGTIVWKYQEPMDERVYNTKNRNQFSLTYGYITSGTNYVEIPGDGAIFINHSKLNNITVDPQNNDNMISNRIINEGEEILENYNEFDLYPNSNGVIS